jgi:Mn-dependent DtxR family transcriptional regulator
VVAVRQFALLLMLSAAGSAMADPSRATIRGTFGLGKPCSYYWGWLGSVHIFVDHPDHPGHARWKQAHENASTGGINAGSVTLPNATTPYWNTFVRGESYPTLQAAIELKLFDHMLYGDRPGRISPEVLAEKAGITALTANVMLEHLDSMGFVSYEPETHTYAPTVETMKHLTKQSPHKEWRDFLAAQIDRPTTPDDYLKAVKSGVYQVGALPCCPPDTGSLARAYNQRLTFPIAFAAEKIGLFPFLENKGSVTADDVAKRFNMHPGHAREILVNLVGTGILNIEDGRYSLTSLGRETTLATIDGKTNPFYWGGTIDLIGGGMITPRGLLKKIHDVANRQSQDSSKDANDMMRKIMLDEPTAELFGKHMRAQMQKAGAEVAKKSFWRGDEKVLDVGGGIAHYLLAMAGHHPKLTGSVMEIPNTNKLAEQAIKHAGQENRLGVVTGDLWNPQAWPTPEKKYDTVFLSYVVHDWKPDDVTRILKTAVATIGDTKDGKIVVHDMFLNESGNSPLVKSAFGRLVWYWTDEGAQYRLSDFQAMAAKAGLVIESVEQSDGPSSVLVLRPKKN